MGTRMYYPMLTALGRRFGATRFPEEAKADFDFVMTLSMMYEKTWMSVSLTWIWEQRKMWRIVMSAKKSQKKRRLFPRKNASCTSLSFWNFSREDMENTVCDAILPSHIDLCLEVRPSSLYGNVKRATKTPGLRNPDTMECLLGTFTLQHQFFFLGTVFRR